MERATARLPRLDRRSTSTPQVSGRAIAGRGCHQLVCNTPQVERTRTASEGPRQRHQLVMPAAAATTNTPTTTAPRSGGECCPWWVGGNVTAGSVQRFSQQNMWAVLSSRRSPPATGACSKHVCFLLVCLCVCLRRAWLVHFFVLIYFCVVGLDAQTPSYINDVIISIKVTNCCLLYTSPSPRDRG